jgi:hypothetical protein
MVRRGVPGFPVKAFVEPEARLEVAARPGLEATISSEVGSGRRGFVKV